jgi:hypothetical protein
LLREAVVEARLGVQARIVTRGPARTERTSGLEKLGIWVQPIPSLLQGRELFNSCWIGV